MLQQREERSLNSLADILTNTIRKSVTAFTISASLLSVWRETGRPMSQSRTNSRSRKPRRKKTMNDKEDLGYGGQPESR